MSTSLAHGHIDAVSYRKFRVAQERALLAEARAHRNGRATSYPLLQMHTHAEWPLWRIVLDALEFRLHLVPCTSPLEDAVHSDMLLDVYARAELGGARWTELQPPLPPRVDMPTVWARGFEAHRRRRANRAPMTLQILDK